MVKNSFFHQKTWFDMPLFIHLLTILYMAASIKHFCRGLESTCNCTSAGKNILAYFFSKSREKINSFQLFHSRDKHLLCVKSAICRLAFVSNSWSGGRRWQDGCCKHVHILIVLFTRLFVETFLCDPFKLPQNHLVLGCSSLSNISNQYCFFLMNMRIYSVIFHFSRRRVNFF